MIDLFKPLPEEDLSTSPSYASVKEGLALLDAWDGKDGAPSHSWPSTPQLMHEIVTATDEQYGGPLTTPTLDYPRPATWDEIRAKLAAEKAAAAQEPVPAPVVEKPAATQPATASAPKSTSRSRSAKRPK